jgi:hypothetical protein
LERQFQPLYVFGFLFGLTTQFLNTKFDGAVVVAAFGEFLGSTASGKQKAEAKGHE